MELTTKNIYQTNPSEDDDTFNFKEVFLRNLKLWRWFLFSLMVSFSIAFAVNKFSPPVYKVESKFLIKEDGNAMDLIDFSNTVNRDVLPQGQKMANETIVLKSRVVAEEVLDLLHFDIEYYKEHNYRKGQFIDSEIYKNAPIAAEIDWNHNQLTNGRIKIAWENHSSYQLEFLDKEYNVFIPGEDLNTTIEKPTLLENNFKFGEWVELPYARFRLNVTSAKSTGTLVIKFRDRESLISQYTEDNLQISPIDKLSSILLLSLETEQPQKGRDYLNTLMTVFLNNELDKKNAMDISTINFIDSQLTGISDTLNYTENKLERFQSSRRTYNISTEGSTIFEQLSDLERQLSEEKYKKEYYQHLQNYLIKEEYSGIVVPSGIGIEDPVLNRLIEDLILLQSDKSRFLATQTTNSPTVLEVNRKIRDLNASIKEVLKNGAYNTDLLISDLENRISKIEDQFGTLPQTEQDILDIKRSYTLNENLYTFLLQKRAESSISLASNKPSNKIIEQAVINFTPMQLKPLLNYFLALLLGFIVPMSIFSLIDFFAVKIKEIKEVEQKLKVPILVKIGHNKEGSQLVSLNQPRIGIAESFRALRTNINFISPKEKQLTIMITSSISGEGKTFCAINLAATYSMSGKKTILVGCDLHKSFKFDEFNISNTIGLSTYLANQSNDIPSIVQKTEYANLDVLVPGPIPPNPAELLISDHFWMMLEELKKSYEIIILDSSPIGLTNETLYLTRYADFCIFVLRQNYSKKSFVDDLNNLKVKKGIKKMYVVLNDINRKYLSYGGYGYGYYSEDKLKQPVLKRIFRGSKRGA